MDGPAAWRALLRESRWQYADGPLLHAVRGALDGLGGPVPNSGLGTALGGFVAEGRVAFAPLRQLLLTLRVLRRCGRSEDGEAMYELVPDAPRDLALVDAYDAALTARIARLRRSADLDAQALCAFLVGDLASDRVAALVEGARRALEAGSASDAASAPEAREAPSEPSAEAGAG